MLSTADQGTDTATWILRSVRVAAVGATSIDLDVMALPAVELADAPGWLTGETLAEQGIELGMPNLPHGLPVPPTDPLWCRCRIEVVGNDAIRVTMAPAGARVFDEPSTWLGIVTTPQLRAANPSVAVSDEEIHVCAGGTELVVGLRPFRLRLGDPGEPILRTSERLRQVAGLPMAPPVLIERSQLGRFRTTLNLELGPDEQILGFGEQFSRVVKNGQQLRLRCEDALGTGTGLAYKPAPVWHSSAGYLAFLNTGATVDVDAGHVRPSVLSLSVDDEAIDLYVLGRPTPAQRMADYTLLTGRARRPPSWAFGYWLGRCRYHSADEVLDVLDEMRHREVPLDVVHIDPDWLVVDRLNTDFIWNTGRFGDLEEFVDELRVRGVRMSLWEVPYLDPASPRYGEAKAAGHLLRTAGGEAARLRGTPTPDGRHRAIVDLTDPVAVRWWQRFHADFLDAGVEVFTTDFGEGCPDDVAARDGTPAHHLHNLYPLRYNGAVSDAIAARTSRPPLVWGRSGWAGSHRYPGQWGGDAESTVAGLQATLRAGLSHALSSPGFWGHDIGGFFGPELTPGLYVRWTQFGALSPFMRAHGLRPREPWAFGTEALEICRHWIRLRYSLLPYLWQAAGAVEREGLPMLRPLAIAFPDDPIAVATDDQYLLGSDLLVAPVLDDRMGTARRRVYVPAGRWHRFDTGAVPGNSSPAVVDGPIVISLDVPIGDMPVLVRDGATIPMVDVDASVRSVEDVLDRPWTARLYGIDEPAPLDGFGAAPPVIDNVLRHG